MMNFPGQLTFSPFLGTGFATFCCSKKASISEVHLDAGISLLSDILKNTPDGFFTYCLLSKVSTSFWYKTKRIGSIFPLSGQSKSGTSML